MTSHPCTTLDVPADGTVFEALAHVRRRVVLRVLHDVSDVAPESLATHVVAEEELSGSLTDDEPGPVARSLVHRHLPKLSEADLVSRSDGVVSPTNHPVLRDPAVETIIESGNGHWDDVLRCLADRRRRLALAVLRGRDDPMPRSELGIEVVRRKRPDATEAAPVAEVERDLHHVHLPRLADAGLVSYDVDAATFAYEGHDQVDVGRLLAD